MKLNNQKVKVVALLLIGLLALLVLDRLVGERPARISLIPPALAAEEQAFDLSSILVKPTTVQEALLVVCQDRGYGEDCAKTLLGMLWKESLNDSKAIGDNGRARGYFQIHYRLHKISIACAEDLTCSANWTLDYLENNGYPRYVNYAIQCHNGCRIANGYWQSVVRWGNRKWGTPLPIDGDDSAAIAMK